MAKDAWQPRRGYLAAALLLAVGASSLAFFLWYFSRPEPAPGPAPAAGTAALAPATVGAAARPVPAAPGSAPAGQPAPAAEGDADPTRDLRHYVMRGEKPTMGEVIKRLHENGIHSGLGAFNPPGTRPPLVGLAVPKDFALPPGYVRHHQVTDDGQPIEAILMFAPDFQLYDAANRPIAMPRDRVVPPELAPPGLPLRRIVIPPPIETSGR